MYDCPMVLIASMDKRHTHVHTCCPSRYWFQNDNFPRTHAANCLIHSVSTELRSWRQPCYLKVSRWYNGIMHWRIQGWGHYSHAPIPTKNKFYTFLLVWQLYENSVWWIWTLVLVYDSVPRRHWSGSPIVIHAVLQIKSFQEILNWFYSTHL